MIKITAKEEREQVKKSITFMEGVFAAQFGKDIRNFIVQTSIAAAFIVICCVSYFFTFNAMIVIIESALYMFIFFWSSEMLFKRYYQTEINTIFKNEELNVNWVTVVDIDKDKRCISYVEDGAKDEMNAAYIVDQVATRKDCESVIKGQRILIVYSCMKEKKVFPLLAVPKQTLQFMQESEECKVVRIGGLRHIPHRNALNMTRKEEEFAEHDGKEVIYCTEDFGNCKVIKHPRIGRSSGAMYVYEWNGREYVLNAYNYKLSNKMKCDYGDIILKKYTIWHAYFELSKK